MPQKDLTLCIKVGKQKITGLNEDTGKSDMGARRLHSETIRRGGSKMVED